MFALAQFHAAQLVSLTSTSHSDGGPNDLAALMIIIGIVLGLALFFGSTGGTVVVVEKSSGSGWLIFIVAIGAIVYFLGSGSGLT